MSLTAHVLDDESIDEFNDYQFDLEYMISHAIEILDEQKDKNIFIYGDFESLEWRFICDTRHVPVYFNFSETIEKLKVWTKEYEQIIISLKSWIASLIPSRSIESIRKYFKYLEDFLTISQVFDIKMLEQCEIYFNHECDDRLRWNICVSTLNFIDFFEEIDSGQMYKKLLVDVKKGINVKKVGGMVRKLPPAKDVLTFSWVLEDFFSKLEKYNETFFRYFPIYIWWTLSNLIPMRPSEFCQIDRNATFEENDRFYVRLPRLKQKNNHHRIQIVDKISIPKWLFEEMNNYIEQTNCFGETITLVSNASFMKKIIEINGDLHKRFTLEKLQYLINQFYEEIIENTYGMKCNQRIRPGDTRHFAFLNLMRQGYHPVEIARLGGHTSLQAQYHYQQHMEYWVDVEIIQLMQRFNLYQTTMNKDGTNPISDFSIDDEFIREKVLKVKGSNFKKEVEIGFCTDPDMYCQVDKCFFCKHWGISSNEFLEKRNEIEKEFKKCKSEVSKLVGMLNNLYSIALKEAFEDDFAEESIEFNQDLFLTKSQLDEKVYRMLNFSSSIAKARKD
ncbi:site-specific integrase [Neobacillus cucumis]|uniref:site-specific integrase n=1 Tax=Neobacillus cucumis TaxID=1740721 RepID=UPI0019634672|nr:site-specific integrase [Neobacillus cucumis]MBM7651779.1 integrase [Neobacillus cucumis]